MGICLPEMGDFHEVHTMLQQRVEQWNEEIRKQGRQEGRQEGDQGYVLPGTHLMLVDTSDGSVERDGVAPSGDAGIELWR